MSTLRGLIPLLAVLCVGCSRHYVVSYGHSPDRLRRFEVVEQAGRQHVVVDSLVSEPYRGVALPTIAFSSDSRHFAYAAEMDSGWTVVVDGVPGRYWTGIGGVLFGPGGGLAYVASDSSGWRVVVDGIVGGPHEAVMQGSLTFSADGSRVAYVAAEGDRSRVLVDGTEEPWYDGIRMLRFGPDGRLGYVGRRRTDFHVVLERRLFGPFEAVADYTIGPSSRLGMVVRRNGGWRALVDGTESEPFDNLGSIRFFGTRQFAYAAEQDGRWFVIRNGDRGPSYDRVRQLTAGGESLFYEAGVGDHAFVVTDSAAGPLLEQVGHLNVGPDGDRVWYLGRPVGGIVSVFHDREVVSAAPEAVFGTLVASDDGEHWAYLVLSGNQEGGAIVMDDGTRVPLDFEEMMGRIVTDELTVQGYEDMMIAWVKAELEVYYGGGSIAARNSHSASTRRNYRAAWRRFQTWAGHEGLSAIPASPETVAAYVAERADDGLSPASLRMDRAAIRYHHTEAGHANPADNEGVRRVLRGLTRQAACEGRTPRQAAALTEEGLAAIRATAHLRRTGPSGRTERADTAHFRGQVDIALVSVMRDALLRRSEPDRRSGKGCGVDGPFLGTLAPDRDGP